jgi:abortive infection bacteriophage resistance protein
VLRAFAHHLASVRNLCAHHSRVWNRKFTIQMKLPRSPAETAKWFNAAEDRKVYNTLLMLALLLRRVNPDSKWRNRLVELLASTPESTPAAVGFPVAWRDFEIWNV